MKTKAGLALKWLYCVSLIAAVIPSGLFGAAGWVGLATGGGMLGGSIVVLTIVLGIVVYRIVVVVRRPHTLDAFIPSTRIKIMRYFGIFLMIVGLIGALAIVFIKPLALSVFGQPGDSGVAFFVVGVVAYFVSSSGVLGLLLFEASRLFGFEAQLNEVFSGQHGLLKDAPHSNNK